MASKNIKKTTQKPKTQNQPKNQKSSRFQNFFFRCLEGKKHTHNLNSFHYIEPVHTKINNFGSQNLS
jgi:hypothetical protein